MSCWSLPLRSIKELPRGAVALDFFSGEPFRHQVAQSLCVVSYRYMYILQQGWVKPIRLGIAYRIFLSLKEFVSPVKFAYSISDILEDEAAFSVRGV